MRDYSSYFPRWIAYVLFNSLMPGYEVKMHGISRTMIIRWKIKRHTISRTRTDTAIHPMTVSRPNGRLKPCNRTISSAILRVMVLESHLVISLSSLDSAFLFSFKRRASILNGISNVSGTTCQFWCWNCG